MYKVISFTYVQYSVGSDGNTVLGLPNESVDTTGWYATVNVACEARLGVILHHNILYIYMNGNGPDVSGKIIKLSEYGPRGCGMKSFIIELTESPDENSIARKRHAVVVTE